MAVKVTVGNNVKRVSDTVSDTATLREVLENNGIDYTRGAMTLDGATLQPGDLDKTFADFGITEKCWLLAVTKADNAAAITIAGESVVVTSALTLEEIKLVEKYRPNALKLKGGEDGKETVFFVGTYRNKNGMINKNGAEFGSASHDGSGRATITFPLPQVDGDVKEAVADIIGTAILDLNKVEAAIPAVIEEIKAEKADVLSNISVQ